MTGFSITMCRPLLRTAVDIAKCVAAPEEFRKSTTTVALVTLGLLAALYNANPSWMYSELSAYDSYVFVGYGLHFDFPDFGNGNYKVARLPWILVQFVFRKLFQPIPAEVALQLSLYIASTVLLYLICSRLFSKTVGVAVAFFAAALTFLHAIGGADYQNSACGPLFLAVIASIVRMGKDKPLWQYAFCGALLSLLLHTFVFYVNMFPYIGGLGLALALFNARRPIELLVICLWVAGGAIATTATLGGINMAFGRSWLFFWREIYMALLLLENPEDWWRPWSMASLAGPYAYLGVIWGTSFIALLESLRIVIWRRISAEKITFLAHTLFLLEVSIYTYGQTISHQTFLDPAFRPYPLYGPLLISLGAFFCPSSGRPTVYVLVLSNSDAAVDLPFVALQSSALRSASRAFPVACPRCLAVDNNLLFRGSRGAARLARLSRHLAVTSSAQWRYGLDGARLRADDLSAATRKL